MSQPMARRRSDDLAAPPTRAQLVSSLARLDASLSNAQLEQLATYLALLLRWNRVYNLTGVADPGELVARHVGESLALARLLEGDRIADLGTGAGLPGVVLAVAEPRRRFWLMESVAKKIRFLTHVCGELGLSHVHVYHGRIEDFPPSPAFDTVVARALAPMDRLVELARDLLGRRGKLVALKGAQLETELERLPDGFEVEAIEALPLVTAPGPASRAVVIRPQRVP